MSRTQRLLELLEILRQHRYPVTGAALAEKLKISLRSLYRDIATLQAQGAHIEGEAGVGYVLRPGFTLPPLMFSIEEIEALILGMRWVAKRADKPLATAANNAIAKIAAILPPALRHELEASTLLVGPSDSPAVSNINLDIIRQVIRAEHKLQINYLDVKDNSSTRTIWPFALAFFDQSRILVAWCELRQDFRHFRLDRITSLSPLPERYPQKRQALLKEWRKLHNLPPQ